MKKIQLNDLYDKEKEYSHFSCKPNGMKKYAYNTVFDENKSVKWNRQEVERLNESYAKEEWKLCTEKNQLEETLIHLIEQYIVQEINVSNDKAAKICEYLYDWVLYCNETDTAPDFFRNLIEELDDLLDLFK